MLLLLRIKNRIPNFIPYVQISICHGSSKIGEEEAGTKRIVKDASCIRTYVECTFNVQGKRCATYIFVRYECHRGPSPLLRAQTVPTSSARGEGVRRFHWNFFITSAQPFPPPSLNYDRFVWWRLPRLPSSPCFQEERERDFSSVQVAHLRTLLPSRRKKMSTCVWALFNLTGRGGEGYLEGERRAKLN